MHCLLIMMLKIPDSRRLSGEFRRKKQFLQQHGQCPHSLACPPTCSRAGRDIYTKLALRDSRLTQKLMDTPKRSKVLSVWTSKLAKTHGSDWIPVNGRLCPLWPEPTTSSCPMLRFRVLQNSHSVGLELLVKTSHSLLVIYDQF